MRLLFLNRSFWPDLEATGQLLTELCVDLSEHHDVTVVAGPSYHVPPTQKGAWQREALGRVQILRTWGTRFSKQRLSARLVNLGSYYTLAALGALRLGRPDIVIAETDPPLLGMLGAALKARWRCAFVYYCQDIYPDVAELSGALRNPAVLAFLASANRRAYRSADRIVVLGEDMRRRLLSKGVAADKVAVVPNWVDCAAIRPLASNPFRTQFDDAFVVMYSGNLGLSQQLDTILDAAQQLRSDARVLFVFIGEGARKSWLENRVRRDGLHNVRFLPYQPKERLSESLGAADLHLVPLQAGLAGCLVPSKVYGILAAGRPFVAMMDADADVAALARQERVGFVSPSGNASSLVDAIRHCLEHPGELTAMGVRARTLAEQRFHRPLLTGQFEALALSVRSAS